MPLGVGGLEVLYADSARYRAGLLSAVAYCVPSGAGSRFLLVGFGGPSLFSVSSGLGVGVLGLLNF